MLLPRRSLYAIAAVVDVALHARPAPVAARALAARHGLPPRYLETILQALVHGGVLRATRGPRGGYELARERRRVSVGDILRAVAGERGGERDGSGSALLDEVVMPVLADASALFLAELDRVTVEHLCGRVERGPVTSPAMHDIGL